MNVALTWSCYVQLLEWQEGKILYCVARAMSFLTPTYIFKK